MRLLVFEWSLPYTHRLHSSHTIKWVALEAICRRWTETIDDRPATPIISIEFHQLKNQRVLNMMISSNTFANHGTKYHRRPTRAATAVPLSIIVSKKVICPKTLNHLIWKHTGVGRKYKNCNSLNTHSKFYLFGNLFWFPLLPNFVTLYHVYFDWF